MHKFTITQSLWTLARNMLLLDLAAPQIPSTLMTHQVMKDTIRLLTTMSQSQKMAQSSKKDLNSKAAIPVHFSITWLLVQTPAWSQLTARGKRRDGMLTYTHAIHTIKTILLLIVKKLRLILSTSGLFRLTSTMYTIVPRP